MAVSIDLSNFTMPIPMPIFGPLNYHDYIDYLDRIRTYISNPDIFTIDMAIQASRFFTLPVAVNAFHKRAKKCIISENGIEEVTKMKDELINRAFNVYCNNYDNVDRMYLNISKTKDVWNINTIASAKAAQYISAVKALSTTALSNDVSQHILNIAFNL